MSDATDAAIFLVIVVIIFVIWCACSYCIKHYESSMRLEVSEDEECEAEEERDNEECLYDVIYPPQRGGYTVGVCDWGWWL